MSGIKIKLPRNFRVKGDKVTKAVFRGHGISAIMARKAAKPKVVSRAKAMGKERGEK